MFFRLKKSGERGYVQIVENKRDGEGPEDHRGRPPAVVPLDQGEGESEKR